MANNLIQEQERIKGMSDEQIQEGLSSDPNNAPFTQFLGAIEMTRRGRQRKNETARRSASKMHEQNVKERLIADSAPMRQDGVDGIRRFSNGGRTLLDKTSSAVTDIGIGGLDVYDAATEGAMHLWKKSMGLDMAERYFNPNVSQTIDAGAYQRPTPQQIEAIRGAPDIERQSRQINFSGGGPVRGYQQGGGVDGPGELGLTEMERMLLASERRERSVSTPGSRPPQELREIQAAGGPSGMSTHAKPGNYNRTVPPVEGRTPIGQDPFQQREGSAPLRERLAESFPENIVTRIGSSMDNRATIARGVEELNDPRFDIPATEDIVDQDLIASANEADGIAAALPDIVNEGETPAQKTQRLAEVNALLRMAAEFTSNPNITDAFTKGALGASDVMSAADAQVNAQEARRQKMTQDLSIAEAKLGVQINSIVTKANSSALSDRVNAGKLAAEIVLRGDGNNAALIENPAIQERLSNAKDDDERQQITSSVIDGVANQIMGLAQSRGGTGQDGNDPLASVIANKQ